MSPTPCDFGPRWRELSEEIMAGIEEWRRQHPQATLQESEAAVHTRLAEPRTRMLQDVALASQAAEVSQAGGPDRPVCPDCGSTVEPRGPRAAADDAPGQDPVPAAQLCGVPDL